MNIGLKIVLLFLFSTGIMATSLPYYVDPSLLEEIKSNQERYEKNPSSNEIIFDLSMSYAATGQVQKGWDLLTLLPESYAQDVFDKYLPLKKENPNEWRYPFKLAFAHFFKGHKNAAIISFK